jgi:IclR family mhp operon transcriptional activator
MTANLPPRGVKTIEALRKGLRVLGAIEAASAATFTELQGLTGWPKASLARVLKTLQEEHWIRRSEDTGRYVLSRVSAAHPERADWMDRLSDLAAGPREALQARVPWPTDLGVRDGTAMLSIDGPYARNSLSANFRVLGGRPPMLRSSLGRCYLAFCPDEERQEILAALRKSRLPADREGSRPAEVQRMVEQARRQGYATRSAVHTSANSPERFGALAVPIFARGRVVAALCVVWIPAVVTESTIVRDHLADLQRAAAEIGGKMSRHPAHG